MGLLQNIPIFIISVCLNMSVYYISMFENVVIFWVIFRNIQVCLNTTVYFL